jgi:glycosyltransferase involved in cell wall biosynthesis
MSQLPPESTRHLAVFIYGLTGGGAQRRTVTLVNGFAARGHRVDLVVVGPEREILGQVSSDVNVLRLDSPGLRMLSRLVSGPRLRGLLTAAGIPALAVYLRRARPHVLLSAASHVGLVSLWARALSRTGTPLVLRASNQPGANLAVWPPVQRWIRTALSWMDHRLYRHADAVIAVSAGVAREVERLTGMPGERIFTVPNPVVTPELLARAREPLVHPWFAPGEPPVVLGAGTLKLQKDFSTLIRAFAQVRAVRPVRLVILGRGPQRAHLERLARKLGVAEHVAFPGQEHNALPWMVRASVFVLSSAWEGLPGALIEAMACGCPVVSTDCPSGPREILEGGRLGTLVPVRDDRALADAILNALKDPPSRDRLRAAAATRYAAEPAVERYLEVLLDPPRARPQSRPRTPGIRSSSPSPSSASSPAGARPATGGGSAPP